MIIKITSFILIKVDSYVNTGVSINAINLCFILIKIIMSRGANNKIVKIF
ncbi:hypothetical protein UT300008_17060 [Clostridium perfringens]